MQKVLGVLIISILIFIGIGCRDRNRQNDVAKRAAKAQAELLQTYQTADSIYHYCGRIDTGSFNRFISKTLLFADNYPEQEIAPEMLYRAGIGSMILAKAALSRSETAKYAKQALRIFDRFQKVYPEHEKVKYCYWQRAIIYDDILGDSESAKSEYRDFINRYPNDSLTPQFEQYLQLLGKSETEINEALNIER